MGEQKTMNRWLVVPAAILIQLCLGAIYAWSVFTPPLKAAQPADVAATYGSSQLGIDEAAFEKMNAELKQPRADFKEVSALLKGTTDKAEIEKLKTRKGEVVAGINSVVKRYVSAGKLDSLQYGFSNAKTQAIFAAGLAAFAVVMVLAGRIMPKVGPRKLAIAGGVVLGLGYVLAGLVGGKSFPLLLLLIGIVGGAGIGLGYVVPIAVSMKWFPDKKGMITGLAVAGFGFGATLWVKLAGAWGGLIADMGLGMTWVIYGIAFFAACAVGSIWMRNPPEGWQPEGWTPPAAKKGESSGAVNFTSGEMLATPQFYMIFVCFVFGAGAGLMSIGLMKAFPMKAMMSGGMDWKAASAAAGTAIAIFFSLANGIGRIAWGTASDKLGRKLSITIMLGVQGVIVLLFPLMAGTPALLFLGATLIGFNFGGNFALFPTMTADTFGTKNVGQNYGWVFLAYGVGGIAGPMLGGKLGDMGNFPLAFTICGVLCIGSAVVAALVKPLAKAAAKAGPAPAAEKADEKAEEKAEA